MQDQPYIVVIQDNLDTFLRFVNNRIAQGYEPVGGLVEGVTFKQAMYRAPDKVQTGTKVMLEPGVKATLESGEVIRTVGKTVVSVFLPDQHDIGRKAP